jgi:Cytochrome c biogenesis factor
LKVKSVFSREFFILLGTSVLLTMWVTVVLGTIFPVIYESITGDKISFGKPYYNKIFGPLSLFLILFMSIGQYLPWGEGKYKLKNYITPLLLSTLAFIITFAFVGEFEIAFSMLFISFGLFVILREFIRDGIKSGRILPMISHIGFFILCSGIAFSQLLYKEGEFGMLPEEKVEFDKYTIKFLGLENSKGPNWEGIRATFEIQENSEKFKISSEKRMYLTWDEPTTEAGIKYGLFEDFYIVFIKLEEGKIFVKVWHNPAVSFIWIGTAIMFIGGMGKFLKKLLKK